MFRIKVTGHYIPRVDLTGTVAVDLLKNTLHRNKFPLCFSPCTLLIFQPEEGSSRYAHLDITAMETAQKVGAEHAQGREDRLTQLENRRRGPPNWPPEWHFSVSLRAGARKNLFTKQNDQIQAIRPTILTPNTHSSASKQKFPRNHPFREPDS